MCLACIAGVLRMLLLAQSKCTSRYGPGQSFGRHVDDSVEMADGSHTEYTLLLYLTGTGMPAAKGKLKSATKDSSSLHGGETIFYGELHAMQNRLQLQEPSTHKG